MTKRAAGHAARTRRAARRKVLHGVAEISDDGYEAKLGRGRQPERRQRLVAAEIFRHADAIQVDAVVQGDDLALGDAFGDELAAHGFRVGDDGMREAVSLSLDELLRGRAPAGSLAPRRDAHADAGQPRRRHAEDVRVKVVGLNDANAALLQMQREAAHLNQRLPVIKTVEAVFGNFGQAHALGFTEQRARFIEAGKVHVVLTAGFEQSRDLQGLALRAALMKTAD